MHVKLTNGQPKKYTIGQLRRDNPNVSFPKAIPDATLAAYGVYPVTPTERPNVDHTKNVAEGTPALVDGVWTQTWDVTDATAEEIAERNENAATDIRSQRDALLAASDWVVIMHTEKGTNIPLDWEVYRQALRDITSHANFPHLGEADWPVKP